MEFKVSVIIPVYNAAQYLEQAVESAVHLEEVGEILLIEDGSPDNALEICKNLVRKYCNVVLLRHVGGVNRGFTKIPIFGLDVQFRENCMLER